MTNYVVGFFLLLAVVALLIHRHDRRTRQSHFDRQRAEHLEQIKANLK